MTPMRTTLITLLATALTLAPPQAAAQDVPPAPDTQPLIGQWRGDVTERYQGEVSHYRMFVSIDADRNGRPVASVSYSLECRGVWINPERRGRVWHFEETITAGRDNCAWQDEVEIRQEADGLHVRLWPVGEPEQLAQAVLRRAQ
jgi:hypothetical protein